MPWTGANLNAFYQSMGNANFSSGGYSSPRPTVAFGSDKYAQENRAWLAREQWADYQKRFQPYEDELIDAVTGTELLDQRLSKIKLSNQIAFDTAAGDAGRYRERYGIQQSGAQQSQDENNRNLAMAQATAGAMNQTRTHIYDRNMAAIGGGEVRQAATAS